MLPLSPEPMRSSSGNSVESVEQPCPHSEAKLLQFVLNWLHLVGPKHKDC